jgi:adenylate cyclase
MQLQIRYCLEKEPTMTSTEPRFNKGPCIRRPHHAPMSVMFVDLDRFMRICINVPPQAVYGLIREFQFVVTETISRFGGEANAYQGDGVLATFGDLAGRHDCATRTLRCARTLLDEIGALTLDQGVGGDELVSACIGLQYGEVWTGTIDVSQRFGPTLIGDAVNVAVRLEQHAHALGTKIVVGDDLMKRARHEHGSGLAELAEFVNAGALFIRGRHASIDVWTHQAQPAQLLLNGVTTVEASWALHEEDCWPRL